MLLSYSINSQLKGIPISEFSTGGNEIKNKITKKKKKSITKLRFQERKKCETASATNTTRLEE